MGDTLSLRCFMLVVVLLHRECNTVDQKLPNFFKKCKINDTECLKQSIQDGLPKIKNGIPEIGLPPIDPTERATFRVEGGEHYFQAPLTFINATFIGHSTIQIRNIEISPETKVFKFSFNMTKAIIEGDYTVKGKIFGESVDSTGHVTDTVDDFVVHMNCSLETHERDGARYLGLSKCDESYEFGKLDLHLSGLSDALNNKLRKENGKVFRELSPNYSRDYSLMKVTLINKFFEKIPLSELFLA